MDLPAGGPGRTYHWTGSAWAPVAAGTAHYLTAVSGSGPNDVWAVGNMGTILHWTGSAWTPSTSGTTAELRGVWATAPYLHNGSVANLYELLSPSAKRGGTTNVIRIGGEFDPKHVGYSLESTEGFALDTTLPGNSDAGHEGKQYGTELSEDDRLALIEYLKTK